MSSSDSFDRIVGGVQKFQREVFPGMAPRFAELATGQTPKVLFLTCSDSRVNPNLITQTGPGELFICRNIGNVVPPHGTADGSVATVMEYAIDVLKVEHVVICGHSGCGAVKSLMDPTDDAIVPRVTEWLRFAAVARRMGEAMHPRKKVESPDDLSPEFLTRVTQLNVKAQVANLRTYPEVAARVAAGTLRIHGWYYEIGTGKVLAWDEASDAFVDLGAGNSGVGAAARLG